MNSTTLLREVDGAAADAFGLHRLDEAKSAAGPRREAYRRSLHEVRTTAGDAVAVELVRWIQTYVRTSRRFPSSREVRERGATLCRDAGEDVPSDSWLRADGESH